MSITKHYSSEVRGNLNMAPIWQPGAAIAPGDVGKIEGGVFVRYTSLWEAPFSIRFGTRRNKHSNQWRFHSTDVVKVEAGAKLAVPPAGAAPISASIDVSFNREGGVVFHAIDSVEESIDDLLQVTQRLQKMRSKFEDYVFVSHVEVAKRFTVLISQGAGASLKLKGETSAIEALNVADARVSIAESRGQIYQQRGDGPVLLRLYGFKWWSSRIWPQAGVDAGVDAGFAVQEDGAESLEELSAHDPVFDS